MMVARMITLRMMTMTRHGRLLQFLFEPHCQHLSLLRTLPSAIRQVCWLTCCTLPPSLASVCWCGFLFIFLSSQVWCLPISRPERWTTSPVNEGPLICQEYVTTCAKELSSQAMRAQARNLECSLLWLYSLGGSCCLERGQQICLVIRPGPWGWATGLYTLTFFGYEEIQTFHRPVIPRKLKRKDFPFPRSGQRELAVCPRVLKGVAELKCKCA